MRIVQKLVEDLKGHRLPAPLHLFDDLLVCDLAKADEATYQDLVDLVLRVRADCIAIAHTGEPRQRAEYKATMLRLIAQIAPAFAARPFEAENARFFEEFAESARAIFD